ncbi:hypothetical protein ACLOJK_010523 [Asimina triloba]
MSGELNSINMPSSRKFFYSRQPYLSQVRNPPISICCVVFGIACFIFGVFAISRRVPANRCSSSEPRSISVVWDVGSDGGTGRPLDGDPVVGSEVNRRKVMGFVGIQTGFGSVGRRRSLRKTWLPSDREGLQRLEEATGLAFRFVIGKTLDQSKMSELSKEVAEYDDFMLLDLEEEYKNLPHKTLAFFKAAYQLFDADFYVKADDDIYLRPDRLSLLLAKDRSDPRTYLGCMKKGPVFTDPKLKWYEPHSHLLGKEYFLHAYGPIYALSADVVASLIELEYDWSIRGQFICNMDSWTMPSKILNISPSKTALEYLDYDMGPHFYD